ncbi:MAG: hypothetical protein AB1345_04095 [Chloroflexota bacterium]
MKLVILFDHLLRQINGVFEFCDDPDCLLRIRKITASDTYNLPDITIPKGAPVVELHMWNEHTLPLPAAGPDIAWAVRMRQLMVYSLHLLAREIQDNPQLNDVKAIKGVTVLLSPGEGLGSERFVQRMGFSIFPYRNPLGRFSEFWENLYTWWLMGTFNQPTLKRHPLLTLRRTEIWISKNEFLQRHK